MLYSHMEHPLSQLFKRCRAQRAVEGRHFFTAVVFQRRFAVERRRSFFLTFRTKHRFREEADPRSLGKGRELLDRRFRRRRKIRSVR